MAIMVALAAGKRVKMALSLEKLLEILTPFCKEMSFFPFYFCNIIYYQPESTINYF